MNKLVKQMSYKILPDREKELQDLCSKFQAIINRGNMVAGSGRDTSFKEDLSFYSIIIPDLYKKVEKLTDSSELVQKVGLSKIIEEWVTKNGKKCNDYLKITGKGNLKNLKQQFTFLGNDDSDDESIKEGGKKSKKTKKKTKTTKKPALVKKPKTTKKL